MKLSEAKQLSYRDIIYDKIYKNADGTPARWRVNGKVQTWKRNPERVKVPIKRGLYEYSYLTEINLDEFSLLDH